MKTLPRRLVPGSLLPLPLSVLPQSQYFRLNLSGRYVLPWPSRLAIDFDLGVYSLLSLVQESSSPCSYASRCTSRRITRATSVTGFPNLAKNFELVVAILLAAVYFPSLPWLACLSSRIVARSSWILDFRRNRTRVLFLPIITKRLDGVFTSVKGQQKLIIWFQRSHPTTLNYTPVGDQ